MIYYASITQRERSCFRQINFRRLRFKCQSTKHCMLTYHFCPLSNPVNPRLMICDSAAIRTQDPRLRRALLYPAELRNQPFNTAVSTIYGGKGGIRTPGASQHGGFQDRCNRPLYHLSKFLANGSLAKSGATVRLIFNSANKFSRFPELIVFLQHNIPQEL